MLRDPLALFTATARDHGKIAYLRGLDTYMIGDLNFIRTILVDREGEEARFIKSPKVMEKISVAVGNGMSTLNGARWKRQRSLANPSFSMGRLATYGPVIERLCSDLIQRWSSPQGTVVDATTELKKVMFNIAMNTLFSANYAGRVDEIVKHLEVLQDYAVYRLWSLMPLPPSVPTPRNLRYRRSRRAIEQIVSDLIAHQRAAGVEDSDTLLASYIRACDDPECPDMTEQQLQEEVLNLFLANHDTTANSIAFTVYFLARHPEVVDRVRNELETVLGGRDPSFEDLENLPYLSAVYKESLRLYPPSFAMSRTTACDVDYDGYHFPKGSNLLISQWTLHRDPDLWDQPDSFRPDRFLPEQAAALDKFQYLPFGAGPRICIGVKMATSEACMMLARIVRHLDFTYPLDTPPRLSTKLFVTARPGIQIAFKPRPQ
jgi:cytochrome P450